MFVQFASKIANRIFDRSFHKAWKHWNLKERLKIAILHKGSERRSFEALVPQSIKM